MFIFFVSFFFYQAKYNMNSYMESTHKEKTLRSIPSESRGADEKEIVQSRSLFLYINRHNK